MRGSSFVVIGKVLLEILITTTVVVLANPNNNHTDPTNANLTTYELFALNQYDTCSLKASVQYTASCCRCDVKTLLCVF